jgi:hypothetical protein
MEILGTLAVVQIFAAFEEIMICVKSLIHIRQFLESPLKTVV